MDAFKPLKATEFYAFGEILWDCLPSGRHAGGAPFNVAAHLAQLGVAASLLSAVGQDALGDEILQVAHDKGIITQFVGQARSGLATGTVLVTLDAAGKATYEIVQPVAWDEIPMPPESLEALAQSRALIFGSLAGRSPYNLAQLDRLLDVQGPLKFFDVNLRPPFDAPARVIALGKRADMIKLNDEEVGKLAIWLKTAKNAADREVGSLEAWLKTNNRMPDTPPSEEALVEACAVLAQATNTSRVCVTRGHAGAALWDQGEFTSVPAPQVDVKDTVGAGDAFMAGLIVGLTRGLDTHSLLEAACRLGAYVASQDGATPTLPPEILLLPKTSPFNIE